MRLSRNLILVPWILIKRTLIKRIQSRTIQGLNRGIQVLIQQRHHWRDVLHYTLERSRETLLHRLESEAADVIALKEVLGRVDPACDVARVQANETVGLAGVAAEADDVGIFGGEDDNVGLRVSISICFP